MEASIHKTNVAQSAALQVPLSNPKEKFGDIFKITSPGLVNGINQSQYVQVDEDDPDSAYFIQDYDGLKLNLKWGIYTPRTQSESSQAFDSNKNPYINQMIVTKKRCGKREADLPNKSMGTEVETFTGLTSNYLSIDLEREVDRYLNLFISVEDVFGNSHTGSLIVRNYPPEAKINNIYNSGGFVNVEYTGTSDLAGMNLYGFTGTNIYGSLEDTDEFKEKHKVITINENGTGRIPMYPRKRFHILASPFDSAGEANSIPLREGADLTSPSGFFFVPSINGVHLNKMNGGERYNISYEYDWMENPFTEIRYKVIPTGEVGDPVLGYPGKIHYDNSLIKDFVATDIVDVSGFTFDNMMVWQNQTNTGTLTELDGEVFGEGAGEKWYEGCPRYSGEKGIYKYAYIDTDSCKIRCATLGEIRSGLCPVNGTFSMPIDEPNSNEINFRTGPNFSKEYERSSTYLKEINEMPAVILNKGQLNKIKEFEGVKGWIGLRRQEVGCLEELFSTNLQNNLFFTENDFKSGDAQVEFLDKDGDNRSFLKNDVGEHWSWVNSSGDHIYKYAGNSGYSNMDSIVNLQTEYVGEYKNVISQQTQRISFDRPKLINPVKAAGGAGTLILNYDIEGSTYSGNVVHPDITKIDLYTGETNSYQISDANFYKSIEATGAGELENLQKSFSINLSGQTLRNIKVVPGDNLGTGHHLDLTSEFGVFNIYSSSQIVEKSLDDNHHDGTNTVTVDFPNPTRDPKVNFSISTKNTDDAPVFLNAIMVGEPQEESASFVLSQSPPHTGYVMTLSVLAGYNPDN